MGGGPIQVLSGARELDGSQQPSPESHPCESAWSCYVQPAGLQLTSVPPTATAFTTSPVTVAVL